MPFKSGPRQRDQSPAVGFAKLQNKPSATRPSDKSRKRENVMAAMGKQRLPGSQTTKANLSTFGQANKKLAKANFLVDLASGVKYSLA